jgi:hypothetical protein
MKLILLILMMIFNETFSEELEKDNQIASDNQVFQNYTFLCVKARENL